MQPIEYISVRRELIDVLPTLASDALKVFVVLLDRNIQQKGTKVGMSLNELARTADVGRMGARQALSFLETPTRMVGKNIVADIPYIVMTPKGKNYVITINEYWIGEKPTPIPFTYDDTDQSKIATAETEIRRLDASYKRDILGQRSGLVEILQGEERDLIQEIEGRSGRGLSHRESYLLGKGVARYGPDRVKAAWRQLQSSKDPIRAAYAMLSKGAKGQAAKQVDSEPFRKVRYREIVDRTD